MNYRRGLFRLWLIASGVALIGVPAWVLVTQLNAADHSCFSVLKLEVKDAAMSSERKEAVALELLPLPLTICTDPADDLDDKRTFERAWTSVTSLRVRYLDGSVETVSPASLMDPKRGGYVALYVRAEMRLKSAVMKEFLKELPLIAGAILILAVIVWWTGRLVGAVAAWARRGLAT